ncbi:hypothetical protein ACNKHM_10705 [Shigella sonnei]
MNHSSNPWKTFGIDHNAQHIDVPRRQQLTDAWSTTAEGQPVLTWGEARNDFSAGRSRHGDHQPDQGIQIHDETDVWYLHVGAGETWIAW